MNGADLTPAITLRWGGYTALGVGMAGICSVSIINPHGPGLEPTTSESTAMAVGSILGLAGLVTGAILLVMARRQGRPASELALGVWSGLRAAFVSAIWMTGGILGKIAWDGGSWALVVAEAIAAGIVTFLTVFGWTWLWRNLAQGLIIGGLGVSMGVAVAVASLIAPTDNSTVLATVIGVVAATAGAWSLVSSWPTRSGLGADRA